MTTMKAYTNLEQSRKLAEFLPLESADMYYSDVPVREWVDKTDISRGTHVVFKSEIFAIENLRNHEIGEGDIPAWSLAALLSVLPEPSLIRNQEGSWMLRIWDKERFPYSVGGYDNPVDACVAMIEKLHELKKL